MLIKNFFLNISAVLALFIGLSFVVVARPFPIQPNANGVYEINNIAELNKLSDYVNNVDNVATLPPAWTSAGKTFILMDDIEDFSKPIGTASNPFFGTFDGNGKTIALSTGTDTITYCGVFGYARNAVIKNLTSTGEINYSNSNRTVYVAGIVAYSKNTSTTNCNNNATITVNGGIGKSYVGGIVGYEQYDKNNVFITNCNNKGTINVSNVSDTSYVGGIIGYGTTQSATYGAVDTIKNCRNLGDVSVSNITYSNLGGIAGFIKNHIIISCSNAGSIISTGTCVGGIVGYITTGYKFSQCLNIGKIKGQNKVGGLIGSSSVYRIDNCANAGWVSGNNEIGGLIGSLSGLTTMQNCLNTGVVQGTTNVYALIGQRYNNYYLNGKVTNCYYDNQMAPYNAIQGMANPASVHSRSTNNLTATTVREVLGDAWTMYPNENLYSDSTPNVPNQTYSYPVLKAFGWPISYLAAFPARLATGDTWDDVKNVVNLDISYHYNNYQWPYTVMQSQLDTNIWLPYDPSKIYTSPLLPPSNVLTMWFAFIWKSDILDVPYGNGIPYNGCAHSTMSNQLSYYGPSELTARMADGHGHTYKKNHSYNYYRHLQNSF